MSRYHLRIYARPILAALAGVLLIISGCFSAEVNQSARDLVQDLDVLERATVPDPRYDEAGKARVETLRKAVKAHAAAIVEATK